MLKKLLPTGQVGHLYIAVCLYSCLNPLSFVVVWMYVIREMEDAIRDCTVGGLHLIQAWQRQRYRNKNVGLLLFLLVFIAQFFSSASLELNLI